MRLFVLTIVLLLAPLAAAAQSVEDQITTQLQNQGFADIAMSRTFLGRLRVVASSSELERELIVNPKTGQILRDRVTSLDESASAQVSILSPTTDNNSDQNVPNDRVTRPVPSTEKTPPNNGSPPPRDGNPPPRP